MQIDIKTYPAKNGDCFLINYGESERYQKHILIDCGYGDTVKNYLKSDLQTINALGEQLERLILTHIDADHIQGAIKLFEDNNTEKFISIKEVWHNTFRHLFSDGGNIDVDQKQKKSLRQIIQRGYPPWDEEVRDEQVISAEQGTTVGALILAGKYSWNNDFGGNAVCRALKNTVTIDQQTQLILLSPSRQKLENLKDFWKDELERYGINYSDGSASDFYDDAFEMLVSWEKEKSKKTPTEISAAEETMEKLLGRHFEEDETATNGSSIAFILQILSKKILFLADSHPGLILQSLNDYQKNGEIIFDLIKVAHHGSFGNTSKELLKKIDAPKYLISTNGARHNHPDPETIANIISRPTNTHRKIYFNYVTKNSKHFERTDWMKKYNYSIHYLDLHPYLISL